MAYLVQLLTVSLIELGESFQTKLRAMDMDERSKVLMACNTKNMGLSNVLPCSLTDTQLRFKDMKSPVSGQKVQNLVP